MLKVLLMKKAIQALNGKIFPIKKIEKKKLI